MTNTITVSTGTIGSEEVVVRQLLEKKTSTS
jgi:hypothetical protein